MKQALEIVDKLKKNFTKRFIAHDDDPKLVRQKHIRLGVLFAVGFLIITIVLFSSASAPKKTKYTETTKENIESNIKKNRY